MSYLLFSLLVLILLISTSQALACYKHPERLCAYTPLCLSDANRKNCTSPDEKYCFKYDLFLQMALRGCAELAFCNASIPFGTRYCCDTDYCNHAMGRIHINWFMIVIMLIAIVVIIK